MKSDGGAGAEQSRPRPRVLPMRRHDICDKGSLPKGNVRSTGSCNIPSVESDDVQLRSPPASLEWEAAPPTVLQVK